MKWFGIGLAAIAVLAIPAAAQNIESAQVSPLKTVYTAGDGQIQFFNDENGFPPPESPPIAPLSVVIYLDDDTTRQNAIGIDPISFYLNGFLYDDRSSGGVAHGRFWHGDLLFSWDDPGSGFLWELQGDLIAMEIVETSPNLFDGSGQFEVTHWACPPGINWPAEAGSIASFTFLPGTEYGDIQDWGQDFTGISFTTIVPDGSGFPEPATCLIFAGLALGVLRRR